MIDINKIRDNRKELETALAKKMDAIVLREKLDVIIELDEQRRAVIARADDLKSQRNAASKTKPDQATIKQMKKIGEAIKDLDGELAEVEIRLKEALSELPNIPAPDVLAGGKENNEVIKVIGEKPVFDFETKDHVDLATSLEVIDYERAAKMSGANFWVYKDQGALLEWALLNYFIDTHRKNGYTFLLPPFLLSEASAYASGHLPKFKEDLFWTQDQTCLNATSEMMLLNYHRDEILSPEELPKRYYAYSACFRREAGSYRKEERGMIRGHQFNKVEMFHFSKPETSWQDFEDMTEIVSGLVASLGLHFQITKLAAQDCSAAMSKTYDVEVWIPSMGVYKEVSSISNATDYQARRANIRYKNKETGKNEFVHTLNGSGLATSRLVPAILEQFQQPDGSVIVPEVLRPFCGFDRIVPKK